MGNIKNIKTKRENLTQGYVKHNKPEDLEREEVMK